MSQVEFPVLLSPRQYALFRQPLMRMLVAAQREEAGQSPDPCLPITYEPSPPNRRYDPELALAVKSVWKKLYFPLGTFRRRRVRLNLSELMLVMLAASRSLKFLSQSPSAGKVKRPGRVRSQLMKSLELARKRLRRKIEQDLFVPSYKALMNQWRPFSAWLRYFALVPRSGLPSNGRLLRLQKLFVKTAVGVAKRELSARSLPLPNEVALRRLVRQALAAVRRGRAGFGVHTLISSSAGATYLADFVAARAQPAL
jgi:hypothetical protein